MTKIRTAVAGLGAIVTMLLSSGCDVAGNRIEKTMTNTIVAKVTLEDVVSSEEIEMPTSEPMPALESEESGWLEPPLYDGPVYFCGTSRDMLHENYPALFENSSFPSTGFELPACTLAEQGDGWIILDAPYINQRNYGPEMRRNGCAPSSLFMGLETIGYDTQAQGLDVFALYDMLGTDDDGTSFDDLVELSKSLGVYIEETEDMSFSEIRAHIENGYPIIMSAKRNNYSNELYCLDQCSSIAHDMIIVGVDPDTQSIFVHDPYTTFDRGAFMALTWETVENIYYASDSERTPDYRYGRQLVLGLDQSVDIHSPSQTHTEYQ